jgi:chromosome segregation ATPase
MYKPTMAELGLCIYQLECLVQELLPELHRHFQMQNYHCSMYASGWFLTLFTSCLPLPVALRVLDLFLCEGMEAIFRVSIAILMLSKEQLLKLDMEGLLRYFQKQVPLDCELDPDYLISLACSVRYDPKRLRKLSKEYGVLKTKEQEEMVELRRLRTENRLLRQRIELLEQESGELADKLIQGQVSRAQEAEDNYVIKRELSALTQREDELRVQLNETEDEVKRLRAERKREFGEEAQLVIDSLQEELVAVKLREAEAAEELRLLRDKCAQLEDCNYRLQEQPPDQAVAQLQEELIAVKLREAEANLAMKELRLKISELNHMWQEHLTQAHPPNGNGANGADGGSGLNSLGDLSQPNSLESGNGPSSTSTASNLALSVSASPLKMLGYSFKKNVDERQLANEQIRLRHELMSTKLREAEASAELKELRQRVMELETQNQVSLNQIRRQADEMHRCEDTANSFSEQQRLMQAKLAEEERRYIDLDSRCKEQAMMNRIKDLEQTQLIAELRQKVAAFEVRREERVTVEKLRQSGQEPADTAELQDRMAELQSEMFRLEIARNKLGAMQDQTDLRI